MADLAVGLSRTVVAGALTKVLSAIDEDTKLRQKAQRAMVAITLELEMMQSFLNDVSGERAMNNLMRTWVKHVRELANDLEDCVEFVAQLDGKPIFWRRLLPVCMVGQLPLDQAVTEIEELKGRAEELSACYLRYSHVSDPASMLIMLQQVVSSRSTGAAAFNMHAGARGVARRQHGLGDLTQLITNKGNTDPHLQVISLWGTSSNLGTTSIIRKAYNDPEISKNFACRAWIKLMHPFNPHEFARGFMAQVYAANACAKKLEGTDVGVHVLNKMEATQEDLSKLFLEEVNTKMYIVVLENLTELVDWDAVRTFLPDRVNGSWIIVSTQQFDIASLCVGYSYQQLELKQFSPDHSVFAFFKEGSQDYGHKDERPLVCEVSPNPSLQGILSSNMTGIQHWMKTHPHFGRELEMNELHSYTAKACINISTVMSVWGIAGIGKSALVRKLYFEIMLYHSQFNRYGWVDVSHPFNLREFSRSLLLDHDSEKDPIKECRTLLSQNKCLIVIDDLRSKEEWDLIYTCCIGI